MFGQVDNDEESSLKCSGSMEADDYSTHKMRCLVLLIYNYRSIIIAMLLFPIHMLYMYLNNALFVYVHLHSIICIYNQSIINTSSISDEPPGMDGGSGTECIRS